MSVYDISNYYSLNENIGRLRPRNSTGGKWSCYDRSYCQHPILAKTNIKDWFSLFVYPLRCCNEDNPWVNTLKLNNPLANYE